MFISQESQVNGKIFPSCYGANILKSESLCLMFFKISQISRENSSHTQVFSCEICEIFKNTHFEVPLSAYLLK